MKKLYLHSILICGFLILSTAQASPNYPDFIKQNFVSDKTVTSNKIWLIGDTKKVIIDILGHPYHQLRVTYWTSSQTPEKSIWILQEIGRERYIDVGIVIENNKIEKLRILAFRESRGWEVKLPFFTKQFDNNSLTEERKLKNRVDSITGATLSWRAVTRLARMALYLDQQRK